MSGNELNKVGNIKDFDIAEKPPQIKDMLANLLPDELGEEEIANLGYQIWENPDDFAVGELARTISEKNVLFELGIIFGIAFEEAYPSGEQDKWPIPLDEREGHKKQDGEE